MPYKDPEKGRAQRKKRYAEHREEKKAKQIAYHWSHRDTELKRMSQYRIDHKPERAERDKKRLAGDPNYHRKGHLKGKYGLTLDEFNSMLASQGGRCASCGTDEWGKKGPAVDHDHGTGLVRGILCNRCNAAAGMLLDDPARAMLLADYLTRCARV